MHMLVLNNGSRADGPSGRTEIRAMNGALSAIFERARRPLGPLLRTRLVARMTTPRDVDDYLEVVGPVWSVRGVRARVVALRDEAGDAVSLSLRPNERWLGFRAGQHVQLSVSSAGVRVTRCFSLSSAPEERRPDAGHDSNRSEGSDLALGPQSSPRR